MEFSLVDALGNCTLYGLPRSLDPYRNSPREQFFETDYKGFERSPQGRLIDKETQRPADQVGRTLLFDSEHNLWPRDSQPGSNYGSLFFLLSFFEKERKKEKSHQTYKLTN